ncbi:hypothetical protein C484_10271 [Natrialba taiwanensis DSM 12281]|uniref:Uncharacterized protein n=1 Tax=Natrialba taiwanensis DSM 12281 TaxID=1230458 RepID=L9ZYH5_9EURY|nr:hypothetical protein C484_10271 [Natrialba taiwanensis DSM 12281]
MVSKTELVFLVETSGAGHAGRTIETIEDEGDDIERVT